MRIVAVSDLHLDWVTLGIPRFDEVRIALWQAVNQALKWKADLFLCCGDICSPFGGAVTLHCAREIVAVASALRRGGIPSVWVAGNHDVVGDGETTSLDPLVDLDPEWVHVVRHSPSSFHLREGGWVVCGLPYPSSPRGWGDLWASFESLRGTWPQAKFIVAGHLSIAGVQPGEESSELARGKDVFWNHVQVDVLRPKLRLAGHYHRRQVTKEGIQVIGSLARLTFGAEDHVPGFLHIEIGRVEQGRIVA